MKSNLSIIEDAKKPKSSFIHVCGKLEGSSEISDVVINVEKINFIKCLSDEKTLISFSNTEIILDIEYSEIMEKFLNQVNLLFHLNLD